MHPTPRSSSGGRALPAALAADSLYPCFLCFPSTRRPLFLSAVLAAAACGGNATAPGTGGQGGGGEGGGSISASTGSAGSTSTSTSTLMSTSAGTGGSTSTSSAGTGGSLAGHLVVPSVIDVPYVVAGKGGSAASVDVQNDGGAPLTGLTWALAGDPSLTLGPGPASLAPGEHATLSVTYAGSASEAIAVASLVVGMASGQVLVPVFGVAGDPGLGASAWGDVMAPGGVVAGSGATVAMPAAPYPDGANSPYTDPSVRVFLATGYRDRGEQDLVVHFHGFDTTVASTLTDKLFQQHVYASGSNAVLVVPQGPVNAADGDFGKLMMPGGLARLLTEVLVVLYRDGKISYPVPGELVLTSHSGGYQAVAYNLGTASMAPAVKQVDLFDSLYGFDSTYEAFALAAGTVFRSNYTAGGGTLTDNQDVAAATSPGKGSRPRARSASARWPRRRRSSTSPTPTTTTRPGSRTPSARICAGSCRTRGSGPASSCARRR